MKLVKVFKIKVWKLMLGTFVWNISFCMEPIGMEIPLYLSCVGKILLEMLLFGIR